jgi:hypothetical protein
MFTLKATTIKTPASKWYNDVDPILQHTYFAWVEKFPGVVSVSHTTIDDNTFERSIVFTDRAAYNAFKIVRETQPGYQARMAHIENENQIVGIQEIEG